MKRDEKYFPALGPIVRDEVRLWTRKGTLEEGVVLAILWCFVHRLTTGKTFEETFRGKPARGPARGIDYQI